MMKTLTTSICQYSRAGIKPENQDACSYHVPVGMTLVHKGVGVVIADGVSACEKAAEASRCCVQGFLSDYYTTPDSWKVEQSATTVISALNNWLYSQSVRAGEQSSMLSTLSILILKSNVAHIFHIGDSRIYHLRGNKLSQLTHDHIIKVNQNKAYLSRAMGFDLSINVDYKTQTLAKGDVFLLTTDGIHDVLDVATLEVQLNQGASSQDLVELALDSGSTDNVSASLVKITELPKQAIDEALDELTQRPIPPDLQQGMKINGYEVESLLVATNKVQIYLAHDEKTGEKVALKTPSINFEDDAKYLKHFLYEEWVGQRIQSANVVKIHNSHQDNKFLAYAMEYIQGKTLRQWMADNPKPKIEIVVSLVKQIIAGLRAFHRQEMLHCDLKPENIMINNIGQVKLIDFGGATIAGVSELNTLLHLADNQGTQGYTAPEVIINRQVSRASDQFSLGAIVYEMLAGCIPYQNKLDKHLTTPKLAKINYVSILHYNHNVPIWIDGAIAKACSLNKENRYEVFSEFFGDLNQANTDFLNINHQKSSKSNLKKYQLLTAISFGVNIILLLLFALNTIP